jgi:hypothetical protein
VDLNYLYHRRGVALLLAKAATSSSARTVHEEMAGVYAKRIADVRSSAKPVCHWATREAYRAIAPQTLQGNAAVANFILKKDGL